MTERWWGEFEIPVGKAGCWRIGPLTFIAQRKPNEWRCTHFNTLDDLAEGVEIEIGTGCPDLPDATEVVRFPSPRLGEKLEVVPALADRSVVARPEVPIHVLGGDELRLFVGTPVWMQIKTPEPRGELLLEIPVLRPNDTWFGPTTRRGELCYAVKTMARLNLENVRILPQRAITEVLLRNEAADPLPIERISLPVPNLDLYCDAAGHLWTGSVTVIRREGATPVEVRLDRQAPVTVAEPESVAPPRLAGTSNVLIRALSSLLR